MHARVVAWHPCRDRLDDGEPGAAGVQEVVFPLQLAEAVRVDHPDSDLFQHLPDTAHPEVS